MTRAKIRFFHQGWGIQEVGTISAGLVESFSRKMFSKTQP
jgi:hypothetical protein